ncbi:MAG: hypothetical protein JW950_10220 [Deltaproteobacteria bacterium]|nr:hypothetical protein [Deltaproteobacteria bacterium]
MQTRAIGLYLVFAAFFSACFAAIGPASSWAQPMGAKDVSRTSYSFSVSPVYQFESDFDRSGSFTVQRYGFQFSSSTPVTDSLRAGISLGYDFEQYDFSGATSFAGADPWSDIHRFSAGLPLSWRASESWSFFVSPQIEWYSESGADDWEDALGYGAVFAATYRLSPGFSVGLGAGVFYRGEETRGFPYIAIDWQITEDLRLANPYRTSPSGPAGLEIAWRLSDKWEVAAGGAYRSFRFRLDNSGVAPNGFGELDQTVGYARLSCRMGRDLKLDLYGGAAFNGEMMIADQNGNELGSDDFETAPILGLSLTLMF